MQTPSSPVEPPSQSPRAAAATPALQQLDYTSLRAVLSELGPLLVPSRFEKAQQSDAHSLQLGLRGLTGSFWLELSWLAEAPRLLAIPPPPRQGDGSTLARQLQHGLRGLALVELHQPAWERVVELRFAPRPGEPPERTLVLELMGRHSNLFLLDAERRVVALARQVRDRQSRLRPIGTGDPYQSPPGQAGEPPRRQETFAAWQQRLTLLPLPLGKALLGAYQGTSPALVRQLLDDPAWASLPVDGLSDAQWQALWRRWQEWLGCLEDGRFQLRCCGEGRYRCWSPLLAAEATPAPTTALEASTATNAPEVGGAPGRATAATATLAATADGRAVGAVRSGVAAGAEERPPEPAAGPLMAPVTAGPATEALAINRGLAGYYGALLAERIWRQRRQALETCLRHALLREREQLAQQQALLEAVPAADALQQQADALLCQPDPPRETIDEAQALYRRARKLRRSVAAITPRVALHRQHLAGLETSLTFLEQLDRDADLAPLEEELLEQLERLRPRLAGERSGGRSRARRRQAGAAEPQPLELRSPAGLRLQVGRNHRQNEWISLRQARRGDLWFHAQELPGSHVVLKGSEAPPAPADLQAAADLAAHFSRGRGNRRVPVLMVDAETLQRIPGAEPGTVRHRGGEVLWGEPERAQPLLQRARQDPLGAEPSASRAP